MTLLSSLLQPSEFDPSLWENPDVGILIHRASQQLNNRERESAIETLRMAQSSLSDDERFLTLATSMRCYHTDQIDVSPALDIYEREHAAIDLTTASGAYAGYYGAMTLTASGRREEALDILAVVEHTFRKYDEHLALALALTIIGGILSDLGDANTATKYFLEALGLMREHGTSRQKIRATYNLLFSYVQVSRASDALPIALELYSTHRDELDPPELSIVYGLLQRINEELGEYAQALEWLQQHHALACQHNVEVLVRNTTIERAVLLMRMQQYEEALACVLQADEFSTETIVADLAARRGLVHAVCLQHLGRKQEAREAYARLVAMSEDETSSYQNFSSVVKEVIEQTKGDSELYDPAFTETYINILQTRIVQHDSSTSFIIDIHARYASRLAQYRREREEQLHNTILESGEQTRREIATAIHDGAGQELAITGMALDLALRELPDDHPSREHVARARDRVSFTAHQLRKLSHTLGTHSLERDGLPTALYNLASDVRSTSRMTITCTIDESLATLPVDLARTIYRTTQTLVSNVLQHAYATHIDIAVTADMDAITVRVADDGRGITLSKHPEGMGWKSIRARTELRGGSFTVTSQPGEGTTVVATFAYSGNA